MIISSQVPRVVLKEKRVESVPKSPSCLIPSTLEKNGAIPVCMANLFDYNVKFSYMKSFL